MRNQNPLWKVILVAIVLLVAGLYALPNIFGEDPAVQIRATEPGQEITIDIQDEVKQVIENKDIPLKSSALKNGQFLLRFNNTEDQLSAADHIRQALAKRPFTTALNLAPAMPGWMESLGLSPMFLGLDLRGGVHFLMEVDMESALDSAQESTLEAVRLTLRNNRVFYQNLQLSPDGVVQVKLRDAGDFEKAEPLIREAVPEMTVASIDSKDGFTITMPEAVATELKQTAIQQNILILRNRVNDLGVAEPIIQRQGEDRIVVELPGVQDTARAKEILGAAATLEFRLVDQENNAANAASTGRVPLSSKLYTDTQGSPVLLKREVILTGESINNASSGYDQNSATPAVFINLNSSGASRFAKVTSENIGNLLAVVFVDNKTDDIKGVDGEIKRQTTKVEDVISIATIQDTLSNRFQISGIDSPQQAQNLALLLRAGSLAAPMLIVEERTVGPSAGQQNVEQGFTAAIISLALVALFMLVYYRFFGIAAVLALVTNLVLIVAVLSALQATLTLPGIAGIILTIGMAVDANVLIFERIREELSVGNSPQAAIHSGFDRAFGTIIDANVTTLIAAIVLFGLGSGPVKGFAITLSIGILATIFSAVVFTRLIVNAYYGRRSAKTISI
jgi:preprotein translocase subunit SecD